MCQRREPSRRGDEPSEDGLPARPLRKISNRTLDLEALAALPDEDVIKALVTVKGIGRWSAEMFLLIFRLHRPDVLPVGDLGIVTAVQRVYRLRKPAPERLRKIGEAWRPYRSVASWYCGGVSTTSQWRPRLPKITKRA